MKYLIAHFNGEGEFGHYIYDSDKETERIEEIASNKGWEQWQVLSLSDKNIIAIRNFFLDSKKVRR